MFKKIIKKILFPFYQWEAWKKECEDLENQMREMARVHAKELDDTREKSRKEIDRLNSKVKELIWKRNPTAKDIVEQVLGRGVKFFDADALDDAEGANYWNRAKSALDNRALTNEIQHIIFDMTQACAGANELEELEEKEYEAIKAARWIILAYKLLEDRLKSNKNPNEPIDRATDEELADAIYIHIIPSGKGAG